MISSKRIVAFAVAAAMALAPLGALSTASAATLTADQIQSVVSLLQAFGVGSTTIATVQQALVGAPTSGTSSTALTSSAIGLLRLGDSGDRVVLLQTILAADPSIYPEGIISGYYGAHTAQAVKRYQKKYGLSQVGSVGPQTLSKIDTDLKNNPLASESDGDNTSSAHVGNGHVCAIVPPGHLIAPGWLRKNAGTTLIIPTCQTLPPGIINQLSGTSTPPTSDTTAPTISGLMATNVATSSFTVSWATSENATSIVNFGTTTSYGSTVNQGALYVKNHLVQLYGLLPATTYHFRVISTDPSGNTATSSDSSVTTLALPDTTAPVISAVSASQIASTTALVSWTTNEAATTKMYFSTSTPFTFAGAMTASASGLTTSHSLYLSGLTASTTYYYALESQDASGNVATTTQFNFQTLGQ